MPRLNWIVAKHNGVFPAQEDMCMGRNGHGRTPVLALHAITHLRRTLGMDSVRICPPGATAGPGTLGVQGTDDAISFLSGHNGWLRDQLDRVRDVLQ